jgi:hypothetical protein
MKSYTFHNKTHPYGQAAPAPSCCNFIAGLNGPVPVTLLGAATWRDIEVNVSVRAPEGGGFGAVGTWMGFGCGDL